MGDIILKTTDLMKKYNNKIVVDNLNIEIGRVRFSDYWDRMGQARALL